MRRSALAKAERAEAVKAAVSTEAVQVAAKAAVSTEAVQVVAKVVKATPAVKAAAGEISQLPTRQLGEIAKARVKLAGCTFNRPAFFYFFYLPKWRSAKSKYCSQSHSARSWPPLRMW